MPLHVHKPIDRPQHISILLPTRQRLQKLQRALDALEESTQDKTAVDVWVYVDFDDVQTRQYLEENATRKYGFKVWCVQGGRPRTMGEMLNTLREKCATNPGIYSPGADDDLITARGWDEQVREVFNRYPDRILLAYPTDPTAAPQQVTWPIVSAEWTNAVGRYLTEYFPYWFDDTWLDQVAQMVQRKVELPFRKEPQDGKGKTHRLRNLVFWQSFFGHTLDERIADATRLIQAIEPTEGSRRQQLLQEAHALGRRFAEQSRVQNAGELMAMERSLTQEEVDGTVTPLNPGYLEVELDAVKHLYRRLHAAWQAGRFADALDLLEALSFASARFPNHELLERHCIRQLQRAGVTHPAIQGRPWWARLRSRLPDF